MGVTKHNMLKQVSVVFILFILSSCIKSQNINDFYFEANIARKLSKDGKTDSAITVYENAFKRIDYVHISYLKKLLSLAKLNEDEARIKKYSQQIKNQSEGTNPKLKDIIDSLIIVDQKVRKGNSYRKSRFAAKCDYKKKCNKESNRYKKSKIALNNWMDTDSLNTHFLLNLFNQYGFLGEEIVGSERASLVFVMLLHYDQDTNNIVLEPILEKARKKGKIELFRYAMILDRHLGGKYTIQKFWIWPYVGKAKLEFSEDDIPGIIQLRESIGIYDLGLRQEEQIQGFNKLIRKKLWRLINYYK
jgi:hypothetical protein